MSRAASDGCPAWCTVHHGDLLGEDDLVHSSAEVLVCHLALRLCAGTGNGNGEGPFVLVGDNELTAHEAEMLIGALTQLVELARTEQALA
jgi:hypothetical protein